LKLVSAFDGSKLDRNSSIQLESLYLQGCAFDGARLSDISGQQAEIMQLPACSIAWISEKQADPYPADQSVEIPVYNSIDREKLLCTLKLANNGS
jgi:dynein heavy chain 2